MLPFKAGMQAFLSKPRSLDEIRKATTSRWRACIR